MTRLERAEVRAGLRATRRYVLSHHEPHDWHRCYTVEFPRKDHPLRLCARCSGIYPGVALGILLSTSGSLPVILPLVALLPAFTVGERVLELTTDYGGSNRLRTATGLLLGGGYGVGIVALTDPTRRTGVILVGVVYAVVAAALLGLTRAHHRRP